MRLEGLEGLLILSEGVLGADETLPGVGVVLVFGEHLAVEAGGLLGAIGGLQEAGELELGLGFEAAGSRRETAGRGRP